MRYRRFEPLRRDLSVLVLGTALYQHEPKDVAPDLLDEWLAVGGNVLDTAHWYGNAEVVIGRWLAERGCRDRVVLVTKGGHHAMEDGELRRRVTPEEVTADLHWSLEVLGVNAIDLYMLHRDDPSRPVGPLVDVLNEHKRAGRILAFGASNWTVERLDEAGRYAAERGLETFACSSVNLSLAVPTEPPWPDVVSARDEGALDWYRRTQTPLFAWSAQAGGFFSGRHNPDLDVVRIFHTDANVERRRRAAELAGRNGVATTDVALAWVLHQPFPTYAIIGPRNVEELRASAAAVELELTPQEIRRLDLEEGEWET